jgi:hypothetical protein
MAIHMKIASLLTQVAMDGLMFHVCQNCMPFARFLGIHFLR